MDAAAEIGRNPVSSTRFSLNMKMSRLTRDGTAEPVSRDQILRRERRQGNIAFPCSADREQDWQRYPVDPYPCYMCDYTCILPCTYEVEDWIFGGGKRHNRVHPGHFATQQGTPFYPAGMSAPDWPTLVFTLPRGKIAWVHPTKATFFQNCTLILDKYLVVSENETLPPAISPADITLRSHQRAPKYTSSRAKHTVRNRHQGPASSSSA